MSHSPSCRSGSLLRGVVFDMDGVLVDSHAVHRKAWRLFLHTLGHDLPDSELDFILDGRKRSDILKYFLGDCPAQKMEEYGRRKDEIFRQIQLSVISIPGVVRFVQELHRSGALLAVATSAGESRARSTLLELGVWDCFAAVVCGEDVALGKPDPAIYLLACDRLKTEPRYLLAVEDAVSGIRAAVAAGFCCLAVASHETPENLKAAGAFHVIRDFEGISLPALEGILLNSERLPRDGASLDSNLDAKVGVTANFHNGQTVRSS